MLVSGVYLCSHLGAQPSSACTTSQQDAVFCVILLLMIFLRTTRLKTDSLNVATASIKNE